MNTLDIILAKSAGYCFGVKKAIDAVEHSIGHSNKPIYTLGPIIHNSQVIEKLEGQGVYAIEDIQKIETGSIIIRSHGVEPRIYDKIQEKKLDLVDATCPYVKNVQKKAREYYEQGYQIIIIGNKNHPEVIGVNGWCNNTAIILDNAEKAKEISSYKRICILSQTTITQEKFTEIVSEIIPKSRHIILFNTICNATINRQEETKELAKKVDAMIIIGGFHSSNTQKLAQISKKYCENTYHIETYRDLPMKIIKDYKKIGITAGASTPDWIIKEVIKEMEKEMNSNQNEKFDFQESLEQSMAQVKLDDIIQGEVIRVSPEEVVVNIGYKADGIIGKNEFTSKKEASLTDLVQAGDKIEVMVLSLNDGEGNVVLSKKRVDDRKATEKIKEAYENKEILNGKVVKSVKGGFIVDLDFTEVFMPISQYHVKFVKDLESVVGQEVKGIIIEYNPSKKRTIFSQRVILEKEIADKKEKVFQALQVGNTVTGTVKSIVKFGVFIDLGGVDGLIHISDLSWGRVNKPEDVLSIGDTVKAKVIEVDRDKEKVKLSLKDLVEEPWSKFTRLYSQGDKIKVKIVKITSFGAFAEIIPGVEGLIHKSEISFESVENVEDFLKLGEEVEVQIINIDNNKRKIGLSMIAYKDRPAITFKENETVYKEEGHLTLGDVFGELFKED